VTALAGLALLCVVAPVLLTVHRDYRNRWRLTEATPVLTCAQLRDDTPSQVAVAARTSAREVIRAPVSGEECVCYWTRYRWGTYEESTNQDTWYTERRTVMGRIVIEDDTGSAAITPELAERTLTGRRAGLVTTASERKDGTDSYVEETTVWLVPPDVPLFVIGQVTSDGTPTLTGSANPGADGVAARSRAEVIDHLATRTARWATGTRLTASAGLVLISAGLTLTLLS
jgi:hypothetical protein